MADLQNPLSDEDLAQLEKALADSVEAEAAINKAKRAGIELPGMAEQIREARQRLQAIKQTYFPDR